MSFRLFALPKLDINCSSLTSEDSAQIETRVRATLLAQSASDIDIRVSCAAEHTAIVRVRVEQRETERTASLSSVAPVDAIVSLVDQSLAEVLAPQPGSDAMAPGPTSTSRFDDTKASPPPTTTSLTNRYGPHANAPVAISTARASPPPSAMEPVRGSPPPSAMEPVRESPTSHRTNRTENPECIVDARAGRVRADALMAAWSGRFALGGMLGIEQNAGPWSYALLAGGLSALGGNSSFRSSEWAAAGEISWQAHALLDLRWSMRLGVSVLVIDAEKTVFSQSGTTKVAGYLELDVARPFWLGRIALAPGIGMRMFSAPRSVYVDGERHLHLSTPTVHGMLSLLLPIGG